MRTIKLLPDYQCYPLWEASPDAVGNIDPADLPISAELADDLLAWADRFDATLNADDPAASGFATAEAGRAFDRDGAGLAGRLQEELGPDYAVLNARQT